LKRAKDLLLDARNLLEAAGAPEESKAALAPWLTEAESQIKDRLNHLLKKVKATPPPPLEDQIRWLKEAESLEPLHPEVKALWSERYTQLEEEVNRLYRLGMNAYADEKLQEAIELWKRAVALRAAAQQPEHKRLMADLARAEQQFKLLKGGG